MLFALAFCQRSETLLKQDDPEAQRALDELQAKGFISEERVAASLLHRRAARLGDLRIRQELQAKGLDAPTVAQALEQLRGTERERAQVVWQRKFGTPAQDARERARQMRFLLARGFSADVVRRVVQGGAGPDPDTET